METTVQKTGSSQKFSFQKSGKKKWLILLAALVAVGAAFFLFPREKEEQNSKYKEVATEYRDLSVMVNGSSTISPKDSYTVIALAHGEILEAPFEEGDVIAEDDLLFQIDTENAKNNVKAAEVGVRQAEIALENARLNQRSLVNTLSDYTLTSNYSGQITQILYDPGDMVAAGQPVANLVDNQHMVLTVPFHSADAADLAIGQTASVTMTATGETLPGTVSFVSTVDTVGIGGIITRSAEITVANPGGITAGTYATASVGNLGCAASGTFTAQANKVILATASGEVHSLNAAEGDWVSAGQAVMTLDAGKLQDQLESAANSVKAAELSLENARLSLDNARKLLDDYTITSPISGTIVEKNYKAGDTLDSTTAASPLAIIYDMSQLEFTMQVDEMYIGQIALGQEVRIMADALPNEIFIGHVDRIGIRGTSISGVTSYPVTIKLEEASRLLPGMNITADILIEEATHLLTVPIGAVSRGNTVLLADAAAPGDPEAQIPAGYREVSVTLGRSDDEYVEVIAGLSEGDVVAIDTSTSNLFESMMSIGMGMGQ